VRARKEREQAITNLDVEAGGDDTGLVDAAVELNNDLARAVVVL